MIYLCRFFFAQQNLALVGRYVQAVITDAQGNPTRFIEGKVEYIDFSGNPPLLIVGNDAIHLGQVLSVASGLMIIDRPIDISTYDSNTGTTTVTTGNITGIHISADGNAYVTVNGVNSRIDRINFVSEAIRLRDTNVQVSHGGRTGLVRNVTVSEGAVWMNILVGTDYGEPVRFSTFAGAS